MKRHSNRRGTDAITAIACVAMTLAMAALAPAAVEQPFYRFQSANDLYEQQDYEAALQTYRGLIEDGIVDTTLYYNAGCALAKLGQKGRASGMFERALKIDPRFAEARENLEKMRPEINGDGALFVFLPLRWLFWKMTSEEFFLVAAAAFWIACFAGIAWLLSRTATPKRLAAWIAVAGLAVFLFFGSFFLVRAERDSWIEAVVIADKSLTYSDPSETSTEQDLLSAGVKIQQIGMPSSGWVYIRLPNGRTGFIREDALELI